MKRLIAIALCLLPGMTHLASAQSLTGAGSTFAKPLYDKWAAEYTRMKPDVRINYQGIGSGGGIKQVTDRTVDFGATDMPMTQKQLEKAPGMLHIPTALGAVVPIYNLPKLSKPIVFSGDVLAEIYLGKIIRWNDTRLIQLNPDLNLPDARITVVHRSDGSGTTFVWTEYLSKVSNDWKAGPGASTTINWPTGRGAKGNDGVAADVKQNAGSIGYVELIYAANNNIAFGDLINAAGKRVHASMESISASAATLKDIPEDLRISLTNGPGDNTFPIASLTWILVYPEQKDSAKGRALVKFLWWGVHDGQALASHLNYSPLPSEFIPHVERLLKSIKADGKALVGE